MKQIKLFILAALIALSIALAVFGTHRFPSEGCDEVTATGWPGYAENVKRE